MGSPPPAAGPYRRGGNPVRKRSTSNGEVALACDKRPKNRTPLPPRARTTHAFATSPQELIEPEGRTAGSSYLAAVVPTVEGMPINMLSPHWLPACPDRTTNVPGKAGQADREGWSWDEEGRFPVVNAR